MTYLYMVKKNKKQYGHNYTEQRLDEEIQNLQFRLRKQAIDTAKEDAEKLTLPDVVLFLSKTGQLRDAEDNQQ